MDKKTKLSIAAQVWRTVCGWNELLSIPLGVALFALSPHFLRLLDGTAGTFDLGTLHAALFGVAAFCLLKGVAWLSLRADFPRLYRWLDDYFESEVYRKETQSWLKITCALCVFFLYFFSLLWLTVTLL